MSTPATSQAAASQAAAHTPVAEPALTPEQQQFRSKTISMIRDVGAKAEPARMPLGAILVDRSNNIRMESSYTEEDISTMMEQILAANGLLQPIVVVPCTPTAENGMREFALIIGFRRSIALKRLEEEHPEMTASVPVLIARGLKTAAGIRLLQLLENTARKGLTVMEQAITINNILADKASSLTQGDVARSLGMTDSSVSKLRAFLHFPEEIQAAINEGRLGFHNADRLRRDIPESHWMQTLDIACAKSTKDFDKYCDEAKARYNPESGKEDGDEASETTTAATTGGTQKAPTMLRSQVIEKTYLPFLKDLEGKVDSTEKKYTEKDMILAREDTLRTVLLASDTGLAKTIAPHLEEEKKKEAEEKASAEATSKKEKFFKQMVRDAEKLVEVSNKPDPNNPDKKQTTLAAAYLSVINDAYALTDDKKKELGFDLPKDKAEAGKILRETHVEMQKERDEQAKKRREAAAAKEAKEKAEAEAAAKQEAPATA